MQIYYMLFRDNVVYIKSDINDKIVEYSLDNSKVYPNVPFYYSIFNNEKIINELKILIKNTLNNGSNLKQVLVAKRIFMIMPDDVTAVTEIERRAFDELGKILFGTKEVLLGSECGFIAPIEEKNYICISRTCRMMILTYIIDKKVYNQKFIENKDYTSDELLTAARELDDGFDVVPNIYLNGDHLSYYSNIGIVVNSSELLKNIRTILGLVTVKNDEIILKK